MATKGLTGAYAAVSTARKNAVGHQRWGDGVVQSLNPDFTFRLTKNMVCGDAHCEWVVERKK